MDVYLCLKDENRSLHKEKLHYLGTPFLKQVYIYNSHPYGNSLHGNQLYILTTNSMINCEDTNVITQTCDEQQTRVKNRVYDIYIVMDIGCF
jgi:hypothetical protein